MKQEACGESKWTLGRSAVLSAGRSWAELTGPKCECVEGKGTLGRPVLSPTLSRGTSLPTSEYSSQAGLHVRGEPGAANWITNCHAADGAWHSQPPPTPLLGLRGRTSPGAPPALGSDGTVSGSPHHGE